MFWYDEAGNVIEEEDGSNVNEYLYVGSQRVARIYNLFSPYYYYSDYLGTSRVSSDENGNKCYDADYFPWGDEQNVYVNTCPQNYKFNGKERDPDMGVYDFGARFFQDSIARFYSPDWSATVEPVPYAELNNPQSLNLYTYALDNPLSLRDVDGHLSNSPGQGDTGQPGAAGCRQYNASDPACGPEAQQAQQHRFEQIVDLLAQLFVLYQGGIKPRRTQVSFAQSHLHVAQQIDEERKLLGHGLQQGKTGSRGRAWPGEIRR